MQVGPSAIAAEESTIAPPKSWALESLNSMGLEDLGEIYWITVKSGGLYNSGTSLFEGDNTVLVWESGPALLQIDTPALALNRRL